MVNKRILQYLKLYKDKFPIELLKQKIIKEGFNEEEFQETLDALNNPESLQEKETKKQDPPTPVRWMKVSIVFGIIFFIFLIFSIVFFISLILYDPLQNLVSGLTFNLNAGIFVVVSLFLIIYHAFYYYGIGKIECSSRKGLKLISFSIMIIGTISTLFLASFLLVGLNESSLTNLSITGPSLLLSILLMVSLISLTLYIIMHMIFSIILFKTGIKKSWVSGVFGIIFVVGAIEIPVVLLYSLIKILLNPLFLIDFLLNLRKFDLILSIWGISLAIVFALYSLFQVFFIKNAIKGQKNITNQEK